MHSIRPVVILVAGLLTASAAFAAEPIPSYEAARKAFEVERAGSDRPTISAADRDTMSEAADELAREMPAPGLVVGSKAPDFTLPNAFGQPVRLYDQLEQGSVVLVFYRGAWCPYCNLQLHALQASLPHFERYGAHVIAITPQKPDKSLAQVEKDQYPFEILSDMDNSVMKAYRLYYRLPAELVDVYRRNFGLDLAEYNGKGRYVLPAPGTFIIDTEGYVRAASVSTDYKERMEPRDIVAVLKTIHRER